MRVMLAAALFTGLLTAQEGADGPIGVVSEKPFVPVYVVNTGASVNFMDHQASSLSSVLAKVGDIGGRPTYFLGSAEFSLVKGPDGKIQSNTMALSPGICQVAYQRKYWGVMLCGNAGILHWDAATLGMFTGQVAVPFDLLGYLTRRSPTPHHGYLTPIARQVDITSRQVKPVWGIQIGTAFGK